MHRHIIYTHRHIMLLYANGCCKSYLREIHAVNNTKVQQRQQILTFGVIALTMRGDTIPGIVAKQLAIPNTSPAYLVMKDMTHIDD